ncbi:glycosyltransferase family 2 protein [archaeon]|nr:glycosyltransferase family 2 protein [archaeon]MBT6761805.1 glycosyltransferase family 2 protein [archaeon]
MIQNNENMVQRKVCAIIPAYNEEKYLAEVISETKKYVDSVIVVDDGSLDKTAIIASNEADHFLKHPVNSGKGVALQTGFLYAQKLDFDVIITIDADLQHDPARIPEFLKVLDEKKADIIIGARGLGKSAPIVYRFGNFVLNTTFSILYGQKITDTQSGYRAFLMKSYPHFVWQSSGYDVETEMLTNARKHGLVLAEIPIATKYHNSYKGTTIFDGVKIFCKMLLWRV